MAYIPYLDDDDMPEGLRGIDANILRISGVHAALLRAHADFYVTLHKRHSPISRVRREMIALRVSVINRCYY